MGKSRFDAISRSVALLAFFPAQYDDHRGICPPRARGENVASCVRLGGRTARPVCGSRVAGPASLEFTNRRRKTPES